MTDIINKAHLKTNKNLSDKIISLQEHEIISLQEHEGYLEIKDVREAVWILKEKISYAEADSGNLEWLWKNDAIRIITEIFGEKLT